MKDDRKYWIISANSLIFFLFAYYLLSFLQQLTTAILTSSFDITIILFHDQVKFILGDVSWTPDAVKTVFSSGPIMLIILGILFVIVYSKAREYNGMLKLFFLWGYLIAFTMVLGSFLVGGFVRTGFGHVLSWSYVMDTGRMLYFILSMIGIVILGLLSGRNTLLSANTYFNNLLHRDRKKFVRHQLVIPAMAGLILITLLKIPIIEKYEWYELISFACIIIPVLIIYLRTFSFADLYFDEEERFIRINKYYILIFTVLIILYRIVFSYGVVFSAE